jgi:hypothetical protein
VGFLKKIPGGILKGLKFGAANAEILGIFGVPPVAITALKGAMGVAEAKGGRDKAELAVLLGMKMLQSEGVDIPVHKARLIIELLRDPDVVEGLWAFNLEEAAEKARVRGTRKKKVDSLVTVAKGVRDELVAEGK